MKKVLVVDDEPVIRQVVREVLTDEGYEVVMAHDGEEALTLLPELRPDVVLLDVMMPGMDGREAYMAIRAHPDFESIPIIMTSAAIRQEQLDDGIAAFLPKPFDLDELIEVVNEAAKER